MPMMEWNDKFELGVKQFDEHHKHLFNLLNRTYDDFTGGADHEALEVVLYELIDYATYHFATEEHWMELHEYPGLSLQRAEHERFSRRVVEIQKDFHKGNTNLSLEVLQFLNNWLSNHILQSDADYGRFAAGLSHDAH